MKGFRSPCAVLVFAALLGIAVAYAQGASGRASAIIYRPPGLSRSKPVPLVLALYGTTGCPSCMEGQTRFEKIATEHGFVIAYPGSIGNMPPWRSAGDLAYFQQFIRSTIKSQNIDSKRVYVAGFSAGAREAYVLGCEDSKQIAAIAAASSVFRGVLCTLSHPVSELTLYGSTEAVVNGNPPRPGFPSAAQTTALWRNLDRCSSASVITHVGPTRQQVWNGCKNASAVGLYEVVGGGHYWPGQYGAPGADAQYNASEAVWSFFASHP
jgi:polyhydroxybutyrate depolymerase